MPRYHVDRSINISASPEKVHETVADFSTWTTWSPWLCAEPDAEVTVTDDSSSVGSVYAWKGEIVGQGEVEHQRLEPGQLIDDEIRFIKPWKSVSRVSFETKPENGGTCITWNMDGTLPWFMFWMKPMMQRFIGMDYERGLRMLKEWIETGEVLSQTRICGVESVGPLQVIGVRASCAAADMSSSMEQSFAKLHDTLDRHGLPKDGQLLSVYHCVDMKRKTFDYTAGLTVPAGTDTPPEMSAWSLPAAQALKVEHTGSYQNLGNAWSAAYKYAEHKRMKQSKAGTFEIYLNNPEQTAEADLRTDVYLPLR